MDNYVTGSVIRRFRESKKLTQEELAAKIAVSSKAVSKWETGQSSPELYYRKEVLAWHPQESISILFWNSCPSWRASPAGQ